MSRGSLLAGVVAGLVAMVLCGAAAAQDLPMDWNLRPKVEGFFDKLEAGEAATLAIVGDSISCKLDSYNWFLRDRFWADYGNSGDGHLGIGPGFNGSTPEVNGPRDGIGWYVSNTGVVYDTGSGPRSAWGHYSPDGLYMRISAVGWVQLKVYGPHVRLHYLKQPGGGVMRLTLDGKVLLETPTDGPLEHASLDLDIGGGPYKIKSLMISSADGAVVQVSGLDMRTGLSGFTYHRLGRGGAGPDDFNLSNTEQTGEIIEELAPDLLIVMLDCGLNYMDTYTDDINALLDFYTAHLPGVPVVLMSHHPFKEIIGEQAVMLYEIAQERDLGFINLYDTFPGGYTEMNDLGFLVDKVHFTAAGGLWFGNYVYEVLKNAGTSCYPDLTGDGVLDLFDFLSFQNLFVVQDPAADCDANGAFDLFDFLCYQNAFAQGC